MIKDRNKVEACDAVIIGTILVCDWMTDFLFDPDSTYSYVFLIFVWNFEITCDVLDSPIHVSTLLESMS